MRSDLKRTPAYDDTSLMSFGKYKGEPLSDIPASYFKWLWIEGELQYFSRNYTSTFHGSFKDKIMLANYIWNYQDAIAPELGNMFI